MTVENDYKRSLEEIYKSFPEETRALLDDEVLKIWITFILWGSFTLLSAVLIWHLIYFDFIKEPISKRIQRTGNIIPVLAIIGESTFIYKLNKLTSVIHPAQLTYEIYKTRKFRFLFKTTIIVTSILICLGAISSGYGDLIYDSISLIKI